MPESIEQTINLLLGTWPHLTAALALFVAATGVSHVILRKRDISAAIGWVGVIVLFPFIGAALYFLFGVNRIKRKALYLRADLPDRPPIFSGGKIFKNETLDQYLLPENQHLLTLKRLVDFVVAEPLLFGNHIEILENGDEAYPKMLEALDQAKHSVSLATYIFNNDKTGADFVDALARALKRGVHVRVLIDYIGSLYSFPPIVRRLKKSGVRTSLFMKTLAPWRSELLNLRNHRKILVVDGKVGFTGGMNISRSNLIGKQPKFPIRDIHFKVKGPVVGHLQETFVEDWMFTTNEMLSGEKWFPDFSDAGSFIARGIKDGPDDDDEKLQAVILGALSSAKRRVSVMTPYFLPEEELISALCVSAMRGVEIDIIMPEKNNHFVVKWASMAQIEQVLEKGCRIWFSPPPFDHSKLLVIDDCWSLIGSTNWDPRSLRLNFEFNVECYSPEFGNQLQQFFEKRLKISRPFTLDHLRARSLPIRLRDGVSRLLIPYL